MSYTTAIRGSHASSVSAALNKELANGPSVGLIVSGHSHGVRVATRIEYAETVINAMTRCGYNYRHMDFPMSSAVNYLITSRTR